MATEVMNERSTSPRAKAENANMTAATATTNAESTLPSLSRLRSRGVLPLPSPSSMSAMAPICVCLPVPVTTASALPRTTNVEAKSILNTEPRAVCPSPTTPSRLSTGSDSPVSDDSSALSERASIILQSAGTRSPSSSSITSPTVSSAAGSFIRLPSRSTTAEGAESFFRFSIALSALYCCTVPTAALSAIMAIIMSVSVKSEKSREIKAMAPETAAAATSSSVITSPNCDKKSVNALARFVFSMALAPYFASLAAASAAVSPCSSVPSLSSAARAGM